MSNRISRFIENRLDEIEQAYEETDNEALKRTLNHKKNRLNKIKRKYKKLKTNTKNDR